VGDKEDDGGVKVYEAYEVKKKRKLHCLLLTKRFVRIFMKSLLHRKKENGPLFTTVAR
jgi:hypothetical protein